jgi:hypothetical protein
LQGTDEQARWEQYLFKEHSRERLAAWARRLAFFRFCRAWGGQANDADQLLVAFRIDSEDDLLDVLGILSIPEKRVPHGTAQPTAGVAYRLDEFMKFPNIMLNHRTMEQPGFVTIAGQNAYAWVHPGSPEKLTLSLANREGSEAVSDQIVAAAERIESRLQPLAQRVIDPPQDNRHCICPKWHPEIWNSIEQKSRASAVAKNPRPQTD